MGSDLDRFLTPDEQARVVAAIRAAEALTSGEIKVHIEPRCPSKDPYPRAVAVFERLGLAKTRLRNAVLLYLASDDRRFAFIGDTGIHAAVGDGFWQEAARAMSAAFARSAYADGIAGAIAAVGEHLARAFPPEAQKENQLSDEISTGDGLKR